ncbi:hypothetical protein GWK91_04675 [Virgibacillus sp. MSP4-1]|uniref:hypothetical protein n=1 Tax=Virgibacillus sp. MSP4-1 TaxID=2700081 RepID=UPI0003A03C37|nr:hypothetical protein [Virgibacillus sp. MSP4-1]QHS22284.1 hypothetical protein GWK91_04675 [Virgibacillus sp. MSP4-1]
MNLVVINFYFVMGEFFVLLILLVIQMALEENSLLVQQGILSYIMYHLNLAAKG